MAIREASLQRLPQYPSGYLSAVIQSRCTSRKGAPLIPQARAHQPGEDSSHQRSVKIGNEDIIKADEVFDNVNGISYTLPNLFSDPHGGHGPATMDTSTTPKSSSEAEVRVKFARWQPAIVVVADRQEDAYSATLHRGIPRAGGQPQIAFANILGRGETTAFCGGALQRFAILATHVTGTLYAQ